MKATLHISLILFTAAMFLVSCGSSIKNAQEFKPNQAPVLETIEAVMSDGSAISKTALATGQKYLITVNAYDPEKKPLTYSVNSDFGTISNESVTDDGYSFLFTSINVSGGDNIKLALAITDDKKATTSTTYDLGTGRLGAVIKLTVSGKSAINAVNSTDVTFSTDSLGYFQIFCDNTAAEFKAMKSGGQYPFDPEADGSFADKTFKIGGKSYALTDAAAKLIKSDENTIWAVFRDANGEITSTSCVVNEDDVKPTGICSSASSIESTSVTTKVLLTFDDTMDKTSLEKASILLNATEGTVGTATVSDKEMSFSITGLLTAKDYKITLSGITDAAGNSLANTVYSFTTLNQITGVSLNSTSAEIRCGETLQLLPTFTPSNAINKNVSWSSDNGTAATVDANGVVTALTPGSTVITATTVDGMKTATCAISTYVTITYDGNDQTSGTPPVDSGHYKTNNNAFIQGINTLDKTYYGFTGWTQDKAGAGTKYAPSSTILILKSNITLYAQWALLGSASSTTISNINVTTATCSSNITSAGAGTLTTRGFCWSTNHNPTIIDTTKPEAATSTGIYTLTISGLNAGTTYYIRSYVTTTIGTAYGIESSFRSCGYTGPAGGYVFYDAGSIQTDSDGNGNWRYMEAAPTDQSTGAAFGSVSTWVAAWDILGKGLYNTKGLVANVNFWPAASICYNLTINGYDDWYLPSLFEFDLMYNLKINGIGGFANSPYWTSTQPTGGQACTYDFSNGSYSKSYGSPVGNTNYVRAARRY